MEAEKLTEEAVASHFSGCITLIAISHEENWLFRWVVRKSGKRLMVDTI